MHYTKISHTKPGPSPIKSGDFKQHVGDHGANAVGRRLTLPASKALFAATDFLRGLRYRFPFRLIKAFLFQESQDKRRQVPPYIAQQISGLTAR
jgi:hypothetical protein